MRFPPEMPAEGIEFRTTDGRAYRALAVVVPPNASAVGGRIQVALDETSGSHLLARYRRQITGIVVSALIVSTVLGYQISRRALRPLRQISAIAQRIQPTTLAERIDTTRLPAELSEVARRFNGMLDRLEESFDRLTHFSVELAHEVRTPLSNLQGLIEQSLFQDRAVDEYRATLSSAIEECTRLARIIDGLLFIARADDPRTQIFREDVDVAAELRRMTEMYQVLATDRNIRLVLRCDQPLHARLDRTMLQRAIDNLVANATSHTALGGTVELRAARRNGAVHIEVADTGSGIAQDDVPHVFDRFFRGRQEDGGTQRGRFGLGLAIVRGIMRLHGGRAALDSQQGVGTVVTLEFPA
jgi:two-component system heavy metal sensor histidine kinase CusS